MPAIGGKPKFLRRNCSPEVLAACNAILSIVVDWWFTQPITDLQEVAQTLGVKKLLDSEIMEDKRNEIRQLFLATCNAKDITDDSVKRRFGKRGFKIARDNGTCPLYAALETVQKTDEIGTEKCSAIGEIGLKKLLDLKHHARIEIKKHGTMYAVRFVALNSDLVNKELLDT